MEFPFSCLSITRTRSVDESHHEPRAYTKFVSTPWCRSANENSVLVFESVRRSPWFCDLPDHRGAAASVASAIVSRTLVYQHFPHSSFSVKQKQLYNRGWRQGQSGLARSSALASSALLYGIPQSIYSYIIVELIFFNIIIQHFHLSRRTDRVSTKKSTSFVSYLRAWVTNDTKPQEFRDTVNWKL